MQETTNIRLSFCIPTLNRGAFIGETLESIVSQATDEVEIVVVDGGSRDNTQEVVRQYQQRFPHLRYVPEEGQKTGARPSGPSSGGFDRDCNRAVELARGKYCWLFTDDDLLKPGAIAKVLEATRQGYGLVIANAEGRGPNLSKLLRAKILRIDSDRVYRPTENQRLFIDVANYLSFVGGVVVRRDLWIDRERRKYFGTAFVHVGVIFQRPVPDDTLVIAEPLVSIRYGNALWRSKTFEIWSMKWSDLIWSFPHFSDAAKNHVSPKKGWRSMKTLLVFRAEGAFSPAEYSRLEPRLSSRSARLTARLIAHLPGSLLNFLGVVYCSVVHPSSKMALLDLMNSPHYFLNRLKRVSGQKN